MDMQIKSEFVSLWRKYFNDAALPITFYYSDRTKEAPAKPGTISRCVIGALVEVRNGRSLTFDASSIGCFGGKKYLGFAGKLRTDFEYFLSCGIPGKMEGERYKKSPEIVRELVKKWPDFKAPAPYVIFKRWDNLVPEDEPEVVIFFAQPDVLSGLFTLANYDSPNPEAVFAPMGSGCSTIITSPYLEKSSNNPRAVIGMFDPSARPFVQDNMLSFAVPMNRFVTMMKNMAESFLITNTWKEIQKRIKTTR